MSIYDKAMLISENELSPLGFSEGIEIGLKELKNQEVISNKQVDGLSGLMVSIDKELAIDNMVGTGYGRQLLPFPKEQIYSEILCHGLGSHYFFPNTRTVLDIGGQDTKAIQVDESGMVTSFNMNDRCAAGCGRFLGYIADQLSIGVGELSDLAFKADRLIKISSTCTVFAGAEVKAKLALGEKRENLVFSLETAMAKRAMSLIARSKGIFNEFTFSGGVAKNKSMVSILRDLVSENYGDDIKINVSPESIFAGSLGAALFAKRKG
jgi:benzoyl-CoA reductase subunit A